VHLPLISPPFPKTIAFRESAGTARSVPSPSSLRAGNVVLVGSGQTMQSRVFRILLSVGETAKSRFWGASASENGTSQN